MKRHYSLIIVTVGLVLLLLVGCRPKLTIEPTDTAGVVYGRGRGTTLSVALVSNEGGQLYLLTQGHVETFEHLVPKGSYLLIHLYDTVKLETFVIEVGSRAYKEIHLSDQKKTKTLWFEPEIRIIGENISQTDYSAIAAEVPLGVNYSLTEEGILFQTPEWKDWPILFDFVLMNWESLRVLGQINIATVLYENEGFLDELLGDDFPGESFNIQWVEIG